VPHDKPPGRPVYRYPGQYAFPEEILTACRDRLAMHTQLQDKIVEWSGDASERVPVESGTHVIAYDITAVRVMPDPGSGSTGWPVQYVLTVVVWTRYEGSMTGDRSEWNRRHWPMVHYTWNALVGKLLYDKYDPRPEYGTVLVKPGFPIGRPLLTGNITPEEEGEIKVQHVTAYGYSEYNLIAPSTMPLNLNVVV
jgi:hypothetical protein